VFRGTWEVRGNELSMTGDFSILLGERVEKIETRTSTYSVSGNIMTVTDFDGTSGTYIKEGTRELG